MKADKDKLEQFIADNKDSFNYHMPSEALRQRIQKELSSRKKQRKNKRVWIYKYSAAAAVIAAAFLLIFYYARNKNEQAGYHPSIAKTGSLPSTDSNKNKKEENLRLPIDSQGRKGNQEIVIEKNEEVSPAEVDNEELYQYARLIEIKQQQMKTLKQTAPELYREFASDVEILENAYKDLKKQLTQQGGDKEQLMEAMIENLKLQTALLSKQLEIYKESRVKKQSEKTSYDKSFALPTRTA